MRESGKISILCLAFAVKGIEIANPPDGSSGGLLSLSKNLFLTD